MDDLYQRAGEAARRGRWVEAVQLYRELLTADPAHAEAHNNLALVLERAGEPAMALDELGAALKQQPDRVELLVNRGAIYAGMKRYEEAEADLRRAIRLLPSHADAHFNLGMVHWRRGLPEEAADAFRRAVDHDPESAPAWYYLGEALNQTGDHSGAQEALERSAQLKPDSRTFLLLGRVFDRLSRPTEAIEMYRQARDLDSR
ncbi:MAG: tetratricopeptide repeat protein [Gemmatimonadales bacterium]